MANALRILRECRCIAQAIQSCTCGLETFHGELAELFHNA